jgi:hypothetical protein
MSKTATVSEGWVYGPHARSLGIQLDTPAWYGWLEAPTTSSFAYPIFDPALGYIRGWMTVRKERRRRGGMYWTVYRRDGQRVHKIYVGRSAAVTHARLAAIAWELCLAQRKRTAAEGLAPDD